MALSILFIGGTGNISSACARQALAEGHQLALLTRGSRPVPQGSEPLTADINDEEAVMKQLKGRKFDVVVDFIAFVPSAVSRDVRLFKDIAGQYVFISTASAYEKPSSYRLIKETWPLNNPWWQYSRDKIACEETLVMEAEEASLPYSIVRPSHTYGEGWLPSSFSSSGWTPASRMLSGKPIVIHGDGTSLWTITHAEDFARAFTALFGNEEAYNETFHITGDEAPTWNEIHRTIGRAVGKEPEIIHIPSDFMAQVDREYGAGLLGDKAHSMLFDNTKIKSLAKGWNAEISFAEGIERSVRWFKAHPERMVEDPVTTSRIEKMLAAWGHRS